MGLAVFHIIFMDFSCSFHGNFMVKKCHKNVLPLDLENPFSNSLIIHEEKECFLLFPNTSKLIKKNSAVPCFSNLLLGVWKSEETLFLVFNILPQKVLEMLWIYHEKITEIFMGFGFIVCNKNANYLCFKMELHRVLF